MKKTLLSSALLVVMLLTACSTATTPTPATSTIPADVAYEVIGTDTLADIRRSLDVRLNKKVSEDVLREIALELKSEETQSYERTFILYYLPDMAVGSGAWATTHFNPTLQIHIYGLSVEEEQTLKTESIRPDTEVVGVWLDEFTSSRITIYQEGGSLYMEQLFADGSSLREELVETSSTLGRRFDQKETSGDYFVLDDVGDLQLRDSLGLISTAKSN